MNDFNLSNATHEKYIDASVAVFMEMYASILTESIHIDTSVTDKEVNSFPESLDKRCRATIQKECAKLRRKAFLKDITRCARVVAIMAAVILSLSSVLFISVEAIRVPIINYYISHTDRHWEVGNIEENTDSVDLDFKDPLAGLIPEEYTVIHQDGESLFSSMTIYQNADDQRIFFSGSATDSKVTLNSEGALYSEQFRLANYDAILVVEESSTSLLWVQDTDDAIFLIIADDLNDEELTEIALQLINKINRKEEN